jgi:hypothetical protein
MNPGSWFDTMISLSLKMRSVMGTKSESWNPSKKLAMNMVRTAREKSFRWPFKN